MEERRCTGKETDNIQGHAQAGTLEERSYTWQLITWAACLCGHELDLPQCGEKQLTHGFKCVSAMHCSSLCDTFIALSKVTQWVTHLKHLIRLALELSRGMPKLM
eukprot:scaffold6102_cov19-Tisochrysis_lutea.AAC.2